MQKQYSLNREAPGFKNSVLRSFDFLLANGRFSCVEANNYTVRFESADTIVRVSQDLRSYETSANIEPRSNPDAIASVEEIVILSGASDLQRLGDFEAASTERRND